MNNDFIAEGFAQLDPKLLVAKPPKILWGAKYKGWEPVRKIEYLEKFAASVNHAVDMIQKERDELNTLCALKESQLISLNENIQKNNLMLQSEVTRMNEDRQQYHQVVKRLDAKIKKLEGMG